MQRDTEIVMFITIIRILVLVNFCAIYQSTMENTGLAKLTSCICPGFSVVYECTVMGGSATVWKGNAFNCANSDNEIVLLHPFQSDEDYSKPCNNGNIVGRSIKTIADDIHTSRLYVKVSDDLIGKRIICATDGETSMIRNTTIFTTKAPYPPPEKLLLSQVDLDLRLTTFNWSPILTDCPAIQYKVLASNCGNCPTTTNHTTVTCTDVPIDGSTCTFAVQSAVCGNVTGNVSDVFQGVLKATVNTEGYIGATVAASMFAVTLLLSVAVFTSVIVILVIKTKQKIRSIANELEQARRSTTVPRYQEVHVERQCPKVTISTNKNIAYGHSLAQGGNHEE